MPNWQNVFVFKAVIEGKQRIDAIYEAVGFCSKDCYNQFWDKVLSFPAADFVETDTKNFNRNWIKYWHESILAALREAKGESAERVRQAVRIHTERFVAFPWVNSSNVFIPQAKKSQNDAKLALAQNLIACGRDLDAAFIFEELKLYDKARELREKDKRITIKRTDISVNLNALLQQFRESGLVAIYRCPHCGGKLKVGKDTSIESLRLCEHCGSEVETVDLVDLLEKALE
jgi:DNA-directed RNA polymerase subunit RPC12/RpoP